LVAIFGGAIAVLFLFAPSTITLVLGSIGAAAGLTGFVFLVAGNSQRIRLIHEFSGSAAELMTRMEAHPDDYPNAYRDSTLNMYAEALLLLRAYEQVTQISRWRAWFYGPGGEPEPEREREREPPKWGV
jgi:hypothetical protein